MGEFLAEVAARAVRPESLAHRISLRLSLTDAYPVVIEAGDDAFFYTAMALRLRFSRELEFFVADGRPKVLSALQILTDMKKMERVFGIVDRDFHFEDPQTLFDGHCLVLDVYSFENYFMEHEHLINIGARMLSLEPGSDAHAEWVSISKNFLDHLRGSLRPEHAAGLWCRNKKKTCNLNNFRCVKYVTSNPDGSLSRSSDVLDRFKVETNADLEEATDNAIDECLKLLDGMPLSMGMRGHYFWEMFVELLNKYRLAVDEKLKAAGSSRARTRTSIDQRHAVEASTSLIAVPELVGKFLTMIVASKDGSRHSA